MEKEQITEEMKVNEKWYDEAKKQTLETLPEFLKKLTENYNHDYGTICHAVAASAIAAAWAVNASPAGGITGFQAGCVMWSFIRKWMYDNNKTGMRIINYDDMLFPQYERKFTAKLITESMWNIMQEEAKKRLSTEIENAHPNVISHWQSIADGNIPWGYQIGED